LIQTNIKIKAVRQGVTLFFFSTQILNLLLLKTFVYLCSPNLNKSMQQAPQSYMGTEHIRLLE